MLYISVLRDFEVSSLLFASSISSSVWVGTFVLDTMVLHEFEGIVHQSSITAHVAIAAGTVHQLLFGVVAESFAVHLAFGFHRSNGRESPTRTTLSLVLHNLDSSFGSPVDVSQSFS